jgi:Ras homolog gene family, member A
VTPEQGRKVAAKMDAVYVECSSKEQEGVVELFDLAINLAIRGDLERDAPPMGSRFSGRSSVGGKRKKRSCKIL